MERAGGERRVAGQTHLGYWFIGGYSLRDGGRIDQMEGYPYSQRQAVCQYPSRETQNGSEDPCFFSTAERVVLRLEESLCARRFRVVLGTLPLQQHCGKLEPSVKFYLIMDTISQTTIIDFTGCKWSMNESMNLRLTQRCICQEFTFTYFTFKWQNDKTFLIPSYWIRLF